uniref:Uncharacterized protein n=1 Tax=Cynoglossus semilaevis TaxID=244447 RepID=A0A3P8W5G6_CYNSE
IVSNSALYVGDRFRDSSNRQKTGVKLIHVCFLIEQNAIFKRQYSTKCAYILILYTLYCFLLMLNIKLLSIMQRRLVNIVVLQRHPATTHDMLHGILFGAGGGSHF